MNDCKVCDPRASIANDSVAIDRLEKVYFCPAKVFTHTQLQKCYLYNNKTCHLLFSSSLLLEGYYYSGGSSPGPLDEAFLQQDHRFVTDSVTKNVLNEPSTRAALSSELGYALGYSVEGATPTDEPAADTSKLNFIAIYHNGMHCIQMERTDACISCCKTSQLRDEVTESIKGNLFLLSSFP